MGPTARRWCVDILSEEKQDDYFGIRRCGYWGGGGGEGGIEVIAAASVATGVVIVVVVMWLMTGVCVCWVKGKGTRKGSSGVVAVVNSCAGDVFISGGGEGRYMMVTGRCGEWCGLIQVCGSCR